MENTTKYFNYVSNVQVPDKDADDTVCLGISSFYPNTLLWLQLPQNNSKGINTLLRNMYLWPFGFDFSANDSQHGNIFCSLWKLLLLCLHQEEERVKENDSFLDFWDGEGGLTKRRTRHNWKYLKTNYVAHGFSTFNRDHG